MSSGASRTAHQTAQERVAGFLLEMALRRLNSWSARILAACSIGIDGRLRRRRSHAVMALICGCVF
jgi:hypothetical protein